MDKTKGSSSTTLLVLSGAFTIVGAMIPSPAGRLLCHVLSAVIAVIAVLLGLPRTRRIAAFVILIAAILQAIPAWEQYRKDQTISKDHKRHAFSNHQNVTPSLNSFPR